jgi:hypothetical protein
MNRFIARSGANLLAFGCIAIIIGCGVFGFRLGYASESASGGAVLGLIVGALGLIVGALAAALTFGPLAALYDMRASLEKLANAV